MSYTNKKVDIHIPLQHVSIVSDTSELGDSPRQTKISKLTPRLEPMAAQREGSGDEVSSGSESESEKKIRDLINKTTQMHEDADENRGEMDEKFAKLRERINDGVAFLNFTKNQIENIKIVLDRDKEKLRNSSEQYCDKTVEEMNDEMKVIRDKLSDLRVRLKMNREDVLAQNFRQTLGGTVNVLKNIGHGDS